MMDEITIDNKNKLIMYMHAGSGNHGCEAIVNSLCHLLNDKFDISVLTNDKLEDERYSLGGMCRLIQEQKIAEHFITHVIYYIYRKLTGDRESFLDYRYKKAGKLTDYDIAISIGGDNYCYDMMVDDLIVSNSLFNKNKVKTVLLGCSVEPDLLNKSEIIEDMKRYSLIISRESVTTNALRAAGISRVVQLPDPAFALETKFRELSQNFVQGGTVGINVSPMILDYESKDNKGIAWQNYMNLVTYILEETDMNVAFIPHVIWARSDDMIPTTKLYNEFIDKYADRITLVSDGNCQEIKGDIARCRFFVGARTHSTIAAYSSYVPTLVAGYSVKSIGIARDLFGTEEGYVVDVRSLSSEVGLVDSFKVIMDKEKQIRDILSVKIPKYKDELKKMSATLLGVMQ